MRNKSGFFTLKNQSVEIKNEEHDLAGPYNEDCDSDRPVRLNSVTGEVDYKQFPHRKKQKKRVKD